MEGNGLLYHAHALAHAHAHAHARVHARTHAHAHIHISFHRPDVFETSAGNVTTNIMTSLLTRRTVGQEAKGRYTCQDLGNPRNQDTVVVTVTERNLHRGNTHHRNYNFIV